MGRAVRDSAVPRQDIFVTTKLGFEGHSDVAGHFKQNFEALDVEYIDLFVSVRRKRWCGTTQLDHRVLWDGEVAGPTGLEADLGFNLPPCVDL